MNTIVHSLLFVAGMGVGIAGAWIGGTAHTLKKRLVGIAIIGAGVITLFSPLFFNSNGSEGETKACCQDTLSCQDTDFSYQWQSSSNSESWIHAYSEDSINYDSMKPVTIEQVNPRWLLLKGELNGKPIYKKLFVPTSCTDTIKVGQRIDYLRFCGKLVQKTNH